MVYFTRYMNCCVNTLICWLAGWLPEAAVYNNGHSEFQILDSCIKCIKNSSKVLVMNLQHYNKPHNKTSNHALVIF